MKDYKYIFGPIPSRRLGRSLGISPIPLKYCNYSCVYCQLGRTNKMTGVEEDFFPLAEILKEAEEYLQGNDAFDVITIVGEGEPTLYKSLKELILGLKALTDKPLAVITNGSRLFEKEVRDKLLEADIVLPSLDCFDEESFRKINRPLRKIGFSDIYQGLKDFSNEFQGQLWLEVMLIPGLNDDRNSLEKFRNLLEGISYDRLFINTSVRPPAEKWVEESSDEVMQEAMEILGGTAINALVSLGFNSEISDDYEAIVSIIKRHPMNQYELKTFFDSRKITDSSQMFARLEADKNVEIISYKNYKTYRYN